MGAYSTLNITRSKAISTIVANVLGGLEDFELENMMDDLLEDRLYNCTIVPDHCEENDDEII